MKQFELILSNGTYGENINKVFGTNSGFVYHRGDKGLCLKGGSGDTVTFAQTLTGIKTILFGIKKNADSKIILDNVTDKLEISAGDISGTGLTNCYIDNIDTDTVGNDYKLIIAEFSAGINFATNIKIAPSSDIYLANKIVFYDSLLTNNQRAAELNSFLQASPRIHEKYPRFMPEHKLTDTSGKQTEGLLLHYNMIPSGAQIVDISGNESPSGLHGNIISSLDGLMLDGKDDYISVNLPVTPAATVKTIAFRIKLATISEMIYEGQSNALLILANAGTLEAADYDHIYINGIEDATVVANQWLNVVITSSTVVDNNTASIGYNSGTFDYGKFEMADFQIWSKEFTATEAAFYSNSFIRNVLGKFLDDCSDGVNNAPVGVKIVSGTFTTQELTSQDSVLKELDIGTKYISCDGIGIISVSNKYAQGVYEFYINKANASDFLFNFIMSKSDGQGNGYAVRINTTEAVSGNEVLDGALTSKFATANSYVSHSVWYKIMVTVNNSGEVATFVKGGAFGNKYVLVGIFTDLTYVTSNYIAVSCGTGDKLIIE